MARENPRWSRSIKPWDGIVAPASFAEGASLVVDGTGWRHPYWPSKANTLAVEMMS